VTDADPVGHWYQRFADREARGQSAIYLEWALGVVKDDEVSKLIATLPTLKRQPNLIFACSRLLGAPEAEYSVWREWLIAHWDAVAAEALVRRTQTNEPRRCALMLPVLAGIPGPIALLEVGASAGLCLIPDRYSYSYGGHRVDPASGPSPVLLECDVTGNPPLPTAMPDIVWRAGIDLNPLRLDDPAAVTWLETLIWPEQTQRRERIRAATQLLLQDPPRIIAGDAVDDLPALAAEAPSDATLVVQSSAAIVYLMPEARARWIDLVSAMDGHWIAHEGPGIVPTAAAELEGRTPPETGEFVLSVDGHAVAWTGGHGQRLDWLSPAL
jgi:hypothetical protein